MTSRTIHAFDTLIYAKKLKKAGFTEEQAEAQVGTLAKVTNNLATKDDLKALEAATKQDLKNFELATKKDFEQFGITTRQYLENFERATKQDFKSFETKIVFRLSTVIVSVGTFLSGLVIFFR